MGIKRQFTVKQDKTDLRDYTYSSAKFVHAGQLPRKIDLRSKMSAVVDQGSLGSCSSNAIVSGLREYQLLRNGRYTSLSRLYHYWHERALEGTVRQDAGATLRDGMKVLSKNGVCPESDWPYIEPNFAIKPSQRAEQDARFYRIGSYRRIRTLTGIKTALAEDLPVVFGIHLYASFQSASAARSGIIPLPNRRKEKKLGGHALLAVGYEDGAKPGTGRIIARNSWGPGWGDGGYCYLPYGFFKSTALTFDYWTGH